MIQEVGKGNTYELVAKSNGTSASITLRSVKNRRTRLSIDVALDDKITISILKANGKFGTGGKICKYLQGVTPIHWTRNFGC